MVINRNIYNKVSMVILPVRAFSRLMKMRTSQLLLIPNWIKMKFENCNIFSKCNGIALTCNIILISVSIFDMK